ncbi:aspartate aminotransferase family protein [Streptomyces sp. NPDC059256]|uniref:aspartate aminotransferase family protein n=1 Tax=Streptomyces sp. NPDC059256 TaxID=3346794 RepID=UPI0036A61E2B
MTATVGPGTARGALDAIRRHLSPQLALVYGMNGSGAIESNGRGTRLTLSDGRGALDFGSYAVTLLGQRHPAVVVAVRAELDAMPVSTRVLGNGTTAHFAAALAAYVDPERLTKVWLGLNGSDAVEAALKLARLATGRTRVIAVEGAYHGKSLGALAATWNARYRHHSLEPLLGGVTHIAADPSAIPGAFATEEVAAVLVEPVQGEGGVRPLDTGFLRALASAAHEHGAFVIVDEIQTGLRRCGPPLVSTDIGLRPDAVLLGKALGGGVCPVSAVVATEQFHAPLTADPFVHTTTFSGHPLGAAAGTAALVAVEALAGRGEHLAALLSTGLAHLARRHPQLIADVRGRGLLWGIEFAHPAVAGDVLLELGRHGLLVSPCLGQPEVLRLLPPLVATDAEVAEALAVLDAVCAAVPDEFRHPAPAPP